MVNLRQSFFAVSKVMKTKITGYNFCVFNKWSWEKRKLDHRENHRIYCIYKILKCYSFKLLIVFLNTELFISRRYIQQFKNGRDHSAPWNCYINVAFLNNRYNVLENLWFLCDVSYTFACIRTSQACNIPEMGLRDKDCEFCF